MRETLIIDADDIMVIDTRYGLPLKMAMLVKSLQHPNTVHPPPFQSQRAAGKVQLAETRGICP